MSTYPFEVMGLDFVLTLGAGWVAIVALTVLAQYLRRMSHEHGAGNQRRQDLPGHLGA